MLRALIARDFPSQAAFARAVGMSPARISQLVNEVEPNLTYAVLSDLLKPFGAEDQTRLYRGWLASHAPPPESEPLRTDDEAVDVQLSRVPFRTAEGEARSVARELSVVFPLLGSQNRTELAVRVGHALSETLFLLDRQVEGVRVASEVTQVALTSGEPLLVADALRLTAIGLRPLRLLGPGRAVEAMERYREYVAATTPSGRLPERWRDHQSSLARDRGLMAWELARRGADADGLVDDTLRAVRREAASNEHPIGVLLAVGVASRLQLASGEFTACERSIERARKLAVRYGTDLDRVKVELTNLRLLAATESPEAVFERAERLRERIDLGGFSHYHRELQSVLASTLAR